MYGDVCPRVCVCEWVLCAHVHDVISFYGSESQFMRTRAIIICQQCSFSMFKYSHGYFFLVNLNVVKT